LLALAACGDNFRAPDAPPGHPDLKLVASQMNGSIQISNEAFASDSCEVVEGCIATPGAHRLLRFATVTENVGTADLALGPVPPPGVSAGIFVWSPCHMHHHIAGYADFELRDATGTVATGRKQGFCLEDEEQVDPRFGPSHGFDCMNQGITPGWADVYGNTLPCQWIDITDVLPGVYELRVVVDASGVLDDFDRSNNEWVQTINL
jgi:hypothetical protein